MDATRRIQNTPLRPDGCGASAMRRCRGRLDFANEVQREDARAEAGASNTLWGGGPWGATLKSGLPEPSAQASALLHSGQIQNAL
jgi:hypothetical protein